MTDLYLNPDTNDIDLTNNVMRLTSTTEELSRQRVQIWLSMFKGEWFANVLAGIPYLANDTNLEQLLGNKDKRVFDLAIKTGITTRKGITGLVSYTSILDRSARTLTISFEAETETGEIIAINFIPVIV